MKKISKYSWVINVLSVLLLLVVLWKLAEIQDVITANNEKEEAIKVFENYKTYDVQLIIIGIHSSTASGNYYMLTQKEDPEYFNQFMEMFWGDDAIYEERDTKWQSNHGWQITFVNSLGEMLTLYVYGEDEVGYGGIGEYGTHFTLKGIDYNVVRQLMQDVQ